MFQIANGNKIGIFLLLAGLSSYSLGIILIFDRGLLLIGNICYIGGLISMIGTTGTVSFFTKRNKLRPSMFFFGGFFVLVMKMAFIGALLQIYGLFGHFYSFLPHLFEWFLSIPGIGPFLKHNRFFNMLMNTVDNRKKANI